MVCDTYQVNGGDEAFLMNLNTPLEFGGTIYNGNVYVSPKGTVTFGQGDYTFWDYPQTPSISIGSYDYHAFASGTHPWGANNDLYVRYGSTSTSICVDWKVMLWGQSSGNPIYIRMIAYVDPTNYTWTPTYQVSSNAPTGARYGLRYTQGGPIQPLNIQTITEPPAPEPTIAPPTPPTPTLNSPQNLTATALENGDVFLDWDAPSDTGTAVERYAVSWSTSNFTTNGWGIASNETQATISYSVLQSTGGVNTDFQFRVRSDNDTLSVYSNYSNSISFFLNELIAPTPTPTPTNTPTPEPQPTETVNPTPTSESKPTESEQPQPIEEQNPAPLETSSPEPTPTEEPTTIVEETTKDLLNDALQDGTLTEEEKELVIDSLLEEYLDEPIPASELLELGLEYKDLPEDAVVVLENGVELTAGIMAGFAMLENPSEIFAQLLTDPSEVLSAIGNVGADMTTEKREEAQTVVVASVVVTQIAASASIAAASASGGSSSSGSSSGGSGGGGGAPAGKEGSKPRKKIKKTRKYRKVRRNVRAFKK